MSSSCWSGGAESSDLSSFQFLGSVGETEMSVRFHAIPFWHHIHMDINQFMLTLSTLLTGQIGGLFKSSWTDRFQIHFQFAACCHLDYCC